MKNNILFTAIFFVSVILCFVFSIICFSKLSNSEYNFIGSIGKNWITGPISDIEGSGYTCPAGKVSIINDEWEGTKTGCFCDGIFTTLTAARCSRKKNNYFCRDIFPINPVPYKEWKSTNLCGVRGPNYLSLKTSASQNGCGSNFKSCGKIDTLNQFLCYPSDTPCPINYMKIESKNYVTPKDNNYTVIDLGINGNEGKAVFSNEFTDDKIINEFRIDDDTPCISPEYKNLNHKPYYLENTYGYDKCTNEIAGEFVDKSFVKVDTITYDQLYQDNQIASILRNLPLFNNEYNYLQANTNLFYRNYIGMEKRCVENILKNGETDEDLIISLINIEDKIESSKTSAIVGMIFGIIGFSIFVIFGCITLCCGVEMKDVMSVVMIVLMIIQFLPVLICGSIIVAKANSNNFDLTPLAQPGCTDQITTTILAHFSAQVSSAKSLAAAYLSFGVIGIACGILSILFD